MNVQAISCSDTSSTPALAIPVKEKKEEEPAPRQPTKAEVDLKQVLKADSRTHLGRMFGIR